MTQNRAFLLLIVGLVAWGLYHALGAYLFNHNPYRALMVLLCVGAYLGGWGWLLKRRQRKSPSRSPATAFEGKPLSETVSAD